MFRTLLLAIALLYSIPSCVKKARAQQTVVNSMPVLKVIGDTGLVPLKIARMEISILITGNIATTTFDLTYYNGTDEVLEGEFDFPLAAGQNICRYALDVNGILREGVVVEKAKARIAYENTIRRKIDPGLVEKTRGNSFRTRIYPIPANGHKRVVIGIEQTLNSTPEGLLYQLPVSSTGSIDSFIISANVLKLPTKPLLLQNSLMNFDFGKNGEGWEASYFANNYTPNNHVQVLLPESKEPQVYTEKYEGQTYFYAHIPAQAGFQDKPNPAAITLLWDVSASAEKRNIKKELELLSMYFKHIGNLTVNLVPFNITVLPAERFIIKNGDATQLLNRLGSFSFDGGTQLGNINLAQYRDDEILLFTDGLGTFGKREILLSGVPVMAVNSSSISDNAYLQYVAQHTHGRFINLAETTAEDALGAITSQPLQFIYATHGSGDIAEFFTQVDPSLQHGLSMAGILKKGSASIVVNVGYGNKITGSRTILIGDNAVTGGNIKRIWANTKIAQLELEYEKNKDQVTKLGKQFSVVTQNTSLLVLDRVEDYLEHEIVPPVELQPQYFTLLKEKLKDKADETKLAFEEAESAMISLKEWYAQKVHYGRASYISSVTLADSMGTMQFSSANGGTSSAASSVSNYSVTSDQAMAVQSLAADESQQVAELRFTAPAPVKAEEVSPRALTSSIQLTPWKPDAPYLGEIDKVHVTARYQKYLELKKDYPGQPSFFVDIARYFFEKQNKQTALLVLSNVVELKLEDPELLRVVADQLMEFNETGMAILLFKELVDIREEEPQAWRDLALAYNEAGDYQQAVDMLYKVVLGNWDNRFAGIKSIALTEMNAIISAHPGRVNLVAINKKFIKAMPIDVRIVIGWSTNDSDIDLWVTDPAKEKCAYDNPTTSSGGTMSGDVTQGYGPEEFVLKNAARGNYNVEVNLYGDSRQRLGGPITIKAELFTNYGKPTQKRKLINCRVTTNKEVIKIGALQFSGS